MEYLKHASLRHVSAHLIFTIWSRFADASNPGHYGDIDDEKLIE